MQFIRLIGNVLPLWFSNNSRWFLSKCFIDLKYYLTQNKIINQLNIKLSKIQKGNSKT